MTWCVCVRQPVADGVINTGHQQQQQSSLAERQRDFPADSPRLPNTRAHKPADTPITFIIWGEPSAVTTLPFFFPQRYHTPTLRLHSTTLPPEAISSTPPPFLFPTSLSLCLLPESPHATKSKTSRTSLPLASSHLSVSKHNVFGFGCTPSYYCVFKEMNKAVKHNEYCSV